MRNYHFGFLAALLITVFGMVSVSGGQSVFARPLDTPYSYFWSIQPADKTQEAAAFSLKLDASGIPHVALGGDSLYYATLNSGNWNIQVVDNTPGVGDMLSLALDTNSYPHMAYRQLGETAGKRLMNIRYAYWNGSQWAVQVVSSLTVGNNEQGWVALSLGPDNSPHIAFADGGLGLRYAKWNGSSWDIQTVDGCIQTTYPSIAVDTNGVPHISYNCAGLRYARWTGSGWHIDIIDTNNVGQGNTSIALDSGGNPHIAYDTVNNLYQLRYVSWNGSSWNTPEVIVSSGASWGLQLRLDGSDLPHIGYITSGNAASVATFNGTLWNTQSISNLPRAAYIDMDLDHSGLTHIVYGTFQPGKVVYTYENTTPGNWTAEQVISLPSLVGRHASAAVDHNNHPHFSYLDMLQYQLRYSMWNGSQWINQIVDNVTDWHIYSSIQTDSSNYPHIAYFGIGGLKYASWDGISWQIQSLGAGGRYASLALDKITNYPRIAFCSSGNALEYASWNGSSWNIQSVDTVCGGGDFGGETSLALDNNGIPQIAYNNDATNDMMYAVWDPNTSQWIKQVVATRSAGRSLALDSHGIPHIAYCGIDPNYPLWVIRYASWNGASWDVQTVDPDQYCQMVSLAIDTNDVPYISYPNVAIDSVKYATWNGSNWLTQTIATNTEWTGLNYIPIAVGSDGKPWIAYADDYSSDLMAAVGKLVTFSDVPGTYWAFDWIERLYDAGITGGCSINPLMYCPDNNVTRDQMAVFLERGMHGSSFNPPTVPLTFTDTSGDFAQYWIEALKSNGITGGCGVGIYCPTSPTTRAQMAVFLLKSEHGSSYTPPPATGTKFMDVPSSYWAASWIEQLANEGITSGCGTNLYCPDQSVTRAQMAIFLVKTFNLP